MIEKYVSLSFVHADTTDINVIDAAYNTALDTITNDGGTPITTTSYKKSGNWYVTIVYKQSKSS
jgi:hypothetical protein